MGEETSSAPSSTIAPRPTLDDAARRLRAFIDVTVAEVLPGRPTELADSSGRQLCDSEVNDDEFEAYSVFVKVSAGDMTTVLEGVRRHWEAQGYKDINPGSGVNIHFDGDYVAGISGFPEKAEVLIGGSTPCFAPAPGSTSG